MIMHNTNISLDILIISCIHYINRKFHDMIPIEYNNNNAQIHILNMTYTCGCNNAIVSDMKCEDSETPMLFTICKVIVDNNIDED